MGGLGNQMFQYSCGKALSVKFGVPLLLDLSYINGKHKNVTKRNYELCAFGINQKASKLFILKVYLFYFLGNLFHFAKAYKLVTEKPPYNSVTNFPNHPNLFIQGYFQSEKYFDTIKPLIKNSFKFSKPADEYIPLIKKIVEKENSVAILVRRDDYLNLPENHLLTVDYYNRAMDYIRSRINNPYFFVFTIGDTNWAKENFNNHVDIEIIENENPDLRGFEKMRLMTICKNNIIANSSFGWWSAWLNENPNKIIIAPKIWLNDIDINNQQTQYRYPESWIKL